MLETKVKKSIVLIGAGGHCKACIDVIESTDFKIAGIIDKEIKAGKVLNYEIIGTDDDLGSLVKRNYSFLVTIGQIKDPLPRIQMFGRIRELNGKLATIIAASAIVSKYSAIGEGTIVMHQALINASVKIGNNCIINNKSLIEHDCNIGDHTHISTAAIINGNCKIGKNVFIGSNAVINNGVSVVDDVVVGAGAVVIKDILYPGTYVGNPVRKLEDE